MASNIKLKVVRVCEELFNKILDVYSPVVVIDKDIYQYYYGYKDKHTIYYNGSNELICRECVVDYFSSHGITKDTSSWKQVRVSKDLSLTSQEMDKADAIDGYHAKMYMWKNLYKFYTKKEIEERLSMFEADYDPELKQMSYRYQGDTGIVYRVTDTYKYDINGAHLDALREIFPKADKFFVELYNKRKENPIYKQYANLFVGTLAQKTDQMRKEGRQGLREKTYNWIVQRTTKKLLEAIKYLDGQLIYAQTDGIIVKSPKNLIEPTKELGGFKLEYQGDTYVYWDKNYNLYQTDKFFGSCFEVVRKDIDLSKGQIVHYDECRENNVRKPINIIKETVKIYED